MEIDFAGPADVAVGVTTMVQTPAGVTTAPTAAGAQPKNHK
jgi:hypothetical protein